MEKEQKQVLNDLVGQEIGIPQPDGTEMKAVVDSVDGDILNVTPIQEV